MTTYDCPAGPAKRWRFDATRYGHDESLRLRLAAMAGHMTTDVVATRRAALIDRLADGRPHTAEALRGHIAAQLGKACWGKRPGETLLRDLRALRRGGIRIAYSRQPGLEGYYLDYPSLEEAAARPDEKVWVERIRRMTVPQKQAAAYAAADFALRQKRLILREERPDASAEQIEREARRLVYGV
jgi:hypothetical protein